MAKIILKPSGDVIETDENTSLLESLRKNGHYVKSGCGGQAVCSDCIVKIEMGEDYISPPEFKELRLIGNVFHITHERLACQTKIVGAGDCRVVVDISEHDPNKIKKSSYKQPKPKFSSASTLLKKKDQVEVQRKEREVKRMAKNEKRQEVKDEKGGTNRPKEENFQKFLTNKKKAKKDHLHAQTHSRQAVKKYSAKRIAEK
jgi:ferredoxin